MDAINKFIVIIQPNEALKEWLKEVAIKLLFPTLTVEALSLEDLRSDSTVYIIDSMKEVSDIKEVIDKHFHKIFEHELAIRCSRKELWPQKLSLELFYKWFTPEVSTKLFEKTPPQKL